MLASSAAFTDRPAARRVYGDGDGGNRAIVPLFLAAAFLFFVIYQLFGVAAAAVVMALFCAFALAANNVKVTRGFPFLRRLPLGAGEGRAGGGGGAVARAAAGMDAAAIMALPATFGYKRDRAAAPEGWAQCAICIGLVRVGEAVRRLPSCGHLFHSGCVDVWLSAHATCPLCRAAVCAALPAPELPV
ncbi:E3 ubiquitin-protein ligase EL5-like [Oryza brachyantha]|uniref:E3 ubiquitin-protein ligase EL5-like n=1 Tax=Oryza brachyantha TaxID=4533 RepID=UPI001ADA88A6|nr:E3 ubiquitin-protein ligase EL5-like [Oryza brachyantha]